MRRELDVLYEICAWLAAAMLLALAGLVLAGLFYRHGFIQNLWLSDHRVWAGYLGAGAGFLALAHTLKRGDHIRVTALLHSVANLPRRVLELASLTVAVVLAALLAYHTLAGTWDLYQLDRLQTTLRPAVPAWAVRLPMVLGTCVFTVALVDEWWRALGACSSAVLTFLESRS